MRKSAAIVLGLVVVMLLLQESTAIGSASSMRRELRRMVGYTIIASDSIADTVERADGKYVKLLSGAVFKIEGLILGPLPASVP
jgi:hypothetical protein